MKYIAFFRGINVGGKNIVKMETLKKLFLDQGFRDVHTYIQSGNVLFSSDTGRQAIVQTIRQSFEDSFGFSCSVMLRTADEINDIVRGLPFTQTEIAAAESDNPNVEHLYVYLADEPICSDMLDQALQGYETEDRIRVARAEIYLLCRQSIRDSKPAAALSNLKIPLTARNWKTLRKLCDLLDA